MQRNDFEMFCLYYLGLNRNWEYRFLNANQIAKELNWTVNQLMAALQQLHIHPDTVLNTDFPLARHQVDIQLAADYLPGTHLQQMAQGIYDEFVRAAGKRRDWLAEIERERDADRHKKFDKR